MEISHLKIIRLLVVDPNLSRAAERLHVTQSALSKRVQQMEAELDCVLFERRGPRGLRPLPAAIELAGLSDRIVTAWESGVKRLQRQAGEPAHFVLVGPQVFLREVVLPWWQRRSRDFPSLQLEVQTSTLSRISIEMIEAGADAGILEHREELADFVCKPIYTERWGVVRNAGTARRRRLADYQWGTYSPRDNPVDVWLVRKQKMAPPTYRFYWADLTAVANWVADTEGAASVLPHHVIETALREGRLEFEALGSEATTRLYLAYAKDHPHRRFLRALEELSG